VKLIVFLQLTARRQLAALFGNGFGLLNQCLFFFE
jgi:hypothetical protein